MTTEHEPHEALPYWTDDRVLVPVLLRRGGEHLVHIRSHIEHEQYRGRGSEQLFQLGSPHGERTYVQSRFYLYAPVESSREQRLADSQAWWYPADRSILLWEVVPASPWWAQNEDPREDLILRTLWLAYERFLIDRFPSAQQLLTTWEDEFHRADWEGFLTTVGYHQTAPATFTKPVTSATAGPERPSP